MNSKKNDSSIKNLLYPELNKPQKNILKKNIRNIKKIEELNRLKKIIKSNLIEGNSNFFYK